MTDAPHDSRGHVQDDVARTHARHEMDYFTVSTFPAPTAEASTDSATTLTHERLARHVESWLAEHGDALVALRRYIHAHPDLSRAEHPTAALLASRLTAAG